MARPQMTLGEFIKALQRQDPEEQVKFDFVHFGPTTLDSYRGYYEQLALGYESGDSRYRRVEQYDYPKVKDLLAHCQQAVGKVFTGWKGGDYTMSERTPLWVANAGETGSTAIVNVEKRLYVTILTEMLDD